MQMVGIIYMEQNSNLPYIDCNLYSILRNSLMQVN